MIDQTRNDRVVHLVINAPPVNVLDSAVLGRLTAELAGLAQDDTVSAVLLEGAGRCFSAGASVEEHQADRAPGMVRALLDACNALADLPVPAVAMVHGACLGGAMELISFCDFVVADPEAKIGQPEIKLSFFPPVACSQLPRLAGVQNAAYCILTGESLSAERAAAMGIVQQVSPRDQWGKIDDVFNGLSAAALRVTKDALRVGTHGADRQALADLEALFLERLYRLEDVEEGIASFRERRKPEWKHK